MRDIALEYALGFVRQLAYTSTDGDADFARRVGERIGAGAPGSADPSARPAGRGYGQFPGLSWDQGMRILYAPGLPANLLGWLLARDEPELRLAAFDLDGATESVRRDILLGAPYADRPHRRDEWIEVVPELARRAIGAYHYRSFDPACRTGYDDSASTEDRMIVERLYEYGDARQLKRLRRVAAAVNARDWPHIVAADWVVPLPGYARWALCLHPACPDSVRARFGGSDPRLAQRMRHAGVAVGGLAEFVHWGRPAGSVAALLALGLYALPEQTAAAAAELAPAAARALGRRVEAWAVLAGLLPDFAGGFPNLIDVSGSVAGD